MKTKLSLGVKIVLGYSLAIIFCTVIFISSIIGIYKLKNVTDKIEILHFIEFASLMSRYTDLEIRDNTSLQRRDSLFGATKTIASNNYGTLKWYSGAIKDKSDYPLDSMIFYSKENDKIFNTYHSNELNRLWLADQNNHYMDSLIAQVNDIAYKNELTNLFLAENIYLNYQDSAHLKKWKIAISRIESNPMWETEKNRYNEYVNEINVLLSEKKRLAPLTKKISEKVWEPTFNKIVSLSFSRQGIVTSIVNLLIFLSIALLIIIILLSWYLVINISKGAKASIGAVNEFSKGQLSVHIEKDIIDRYDEFGHINTSIQNMIYTLKKIVVGIKSTSNQILSSGNEVSKSSINLSSVASEQAASLEEISSTMEEISSIAIENTNKAQSAVKIAQSAAIDIDKVQQESKKSIQSIKDITDRINIINDIAFQTNLLALNAAVEAARAGVHGKGFSVVAAEVRKLAERSKKGADEIVKISAISIKQTEMAGVMLERIVPDIKVTAQNIEEIALSSIEQSHGINQVNTTIQEINANTQNNVATAEELSANAQLLNDLSYELQNDINFFKE